MIAIELFPINLFSSASFIVSSLCLIVIPTSINKRVLKPVACSLFVLVLSSKMTRHAIMCFSNAVDLLT